MSIATKPVDDLVTVLSGTTSPKLLTLHDLCDGNESGVESALVRVAKYGRVIDFCGHHFESHELALMLEGWAVTDDIRPNPELRKRAAEPDVEELAVFPPEPSSNPFAVPDSPNTAGWSVADDADTPDAGL